MNKQEKLLMFAEVQAELKDELGVDISIEEIIKVFVSQFKIMAYGFIKGIATTIPFFGKFIPTDKYFLRHTFINPNRIEQARLIKEGDIDGAVIVYKESLEAVKDFKKKQLQIPTLSAEQILAYNSHIEIPDELDITKNMK